MFYEECFFALKTNVITLKKLWALQKRKILTPIASPAIMQLLLAFWSVYLCIFSICFNLSVLIMNYL